MASCQLFMMVSKQCDLNDEIKLLISISFFPLSITLCKLHIMYCELSNTALQHHIAIAEEWLQYIKSQKSKSNQIIIILRPPMLSIRLYRPGKHVLIFPRVVTMPSLCNHSVRHPLHSGSVLTSVTVSHIHWSPI